MISLLLHSYNVAIKGKLFLKTHAVTIVVQDKARFYIEQVLGDDFIPLAIETYDCFHLYFDFFFASCVHPYIICH
jgi:hypothetical protein